MGATTRDPSHSEWRSRFCDVEAREGFSCSCRLGVAHTDDHLCKCGYSWPVEQAA